MKSKILFISSVNLEIENGILQRMRQLLKILAEKHELTVFNLHSNYIATENWLKENGINASVLVNPFVAMSRAANRIYYISQIVLCNKLGLIRNFNTRLSLALPESIASEFDNLFIYYLMPFFFLDLGRFREKVIIDLGDVMADRHKRTGIKSWYSFDEDDERRALACAHTCFAITPDDAEIFKTKYNKSLEVLPFIPTQLDSILGVANNHKTKTLGFIGAPNAQNREVIRYLLSDQFQKIRQELKINLLLGGTISSEVVERYGESVRPLLYRETGKVENLEDFLSEINAVINIAGPSTGVKVKSVEALLAGKALVATRWGVDGNLLDYFKEEIFLVKWPLEENDIKLAIIKCFENRKCPKDNIQRFVAEMENKIENLLELLV